MIRLRLSKKECDIAAHSFYCSFFVLLFDRYIIEETRNYMLGL